MTDIDATYDLSANANVADTSLDAASSGSLGASAGTNGLDAGAAVDAMGGVTGDKLDLAVGGGLDGAASAAPDGGSLSLSGAFDAMLDVMGSLMANLGGGLSALLGF